MSNVSENPVDAELWLLNSCTVKSPAEDHLRSGVLFPSCAQLDSFYDPVANANGPPNFRASCNTGYSPFCCKIPIRSHELITFFYSICSHCITDRIGC